MASDARGKQAIDRFWAPVEKVRELPRFCLDHARMPFVIAEPSTGVRLLDLRRGSRQEGMDPRERMEVWGEAP
jgi:hypothetical protein